MSLAKYVQKFNTKLTFLPIKKELSKKLIFFTRPLALGTNLSVPMLGHLRNVPRLDKVGGVHKR